MFLARAAAPRRRHVGTHFPCGGASFCCSSHASSERMCAAPNVRPSHMPIWPLATMASTTPRGLSSGTLCLNGQTRRTRRDLGAVWLQGHGLSVASQALGFSSRVPRAASRLQMQQPEEPVVASHGAAKRALRPHAGVCPHPATRQTSISPRPPATPPFRPLASSRIASAAAGSIQSRVP